MELENIKSQPIEQRMVTIVNLVMGSYESSISNKEIKENFPLEIKAIKLANKPLLDERRDDDLSKIISKAIEIYSESSQLK